MNLSGKIQKLFEGTELSDEFKDNLETLLEVTIKERVNDEIQEITEQLEAEAKESLNEKLKKVSDYIEYVVEDYFRENAERHELLELKAKAEKYDELREGLDTLFETSHLVKPKYDEHDLNEEVMDENERLERKVSSMTSDVVSLKTENRRMEKKLVFLEKTQDLSLKQKTELADFLTEDEHLEIDKFSSKIDRMKGILFEKTETTKGRMPVVESGDEYVDYGLIMNENSDHKENDPWVDSIAKLL